MLNQTVLGLLYKPCWPGLAQLSFMTVYTVKQTGLTRAGPQKCASVNVALVLLSYFDAEKIQQSPCLKKIRHFDIEGYAMEIHVQAF